MDLTKLPLDIERYIEDFVFGTREYRLINRINDNKRYRETLDICFGQIMWCVATEQSVKETLKSVEEYTMGGLNIVRKGEEDYAPNDDSFIPNDESDGDYFDYTWDEMEGGAYN